MEPTTELTLRKPNVALVMVHRAGKLTGIERKLFNSVLLSSISQLTNYRATQGGEPGNTHLYAAPADELLDPIEKGKSNLKSSLRKHMLSLRRAEVDWEAPDAKSGPVWKNLSLLSQAEFELRNGRLWALWALPPDLNAAIADPKRFPYTKTYLSKVAALDGYTAVALYDICNRYRTNFLKGGDGVCLTSSNPPDWWVDALTNNIPSVDKATGLTKRREWRKVKNEAVLDAIEQINTKTDLDVELIESKRPGEKAISSVQFSLRAKREVVREIPQRHFELITLGIRMGLTEAKVETALEAYTEGQVGLALAKLEARLQRSDLPAIENRATYFSSLLQDQAPIKLVAERSPPRGLDVAQESLSTAAQSTDDPQRSKARGEFMALADSRKAVYAERAVAVLRDRGLLTERIARNAADGVWSGLLLSEMIRLFGSDQTSIVAAAETLHRP